MGKKDDYSKKLLSLDDWDEYLLQESGLPGPRGNLELAQAVADLGSYELFSRYIGYTADRAPVNSPYEFLAFCGVVGLGRLLAEGDLSHFTTLRIFASDPRWRLREAVAMALQRLGDVNMPALVREMRDWAIVSPLEQRAAAAALCEPRLLVDEASARATLEILDKITTSILDFQERRSDAFRTLRQGLGYCWSVAVAALPAVGKANIEKWLNEPDEDIRWIMKQNLGKARLSRMDAAWVAEARSRLSVKEVD
jgi:hypothetical protein